MWLLNYFPSWVFTLLFFSGIVAYLIPSTVKTLPYGTLIKYMSVAIIFLATYLSGAKADHDAWKKRTADLEKQVLELQVKSEKSNAEVVTKVVTKQQVIKEKGQDIIKYIDREIVKYDNTCVLPKELLEVHNKAATK